MGQYRPGMVINDLETLEIAGPMDQAQWRPIEEAYPEIKNAGTNAGFRQVRNATIWPVAYVARRHLEAIAKTADSTHFVYPLYAGQRLIAVLVHVAGGYASLHIYRLNPGRRR